MGLAFTGVFRGSAPLLKLATIGCVIIGIAGCAQPGQPGLSARCLQHQALVEKDGLQDPQVMASLKVSVALPEHWERLPLDMTLLYTHEQWRSPSMQTGVGVAYIHLPIPLSAKMLIWFAEMQYSKKADPGDGSGGRLIGAWSDSLGRQWFEAENSKYHVRGYAMTHQFDAWIVYSGYRVKGPPRLDEISEAQRCADSIAPVSVGPSRPSDVSSSEFASAVK